MISASGVFLPKWLQCWILICFAGASLDWPSPTSVLQYHEEFVCSLFTWIVGCEFHSLADKRIKWNICLCRSLIWICENEFWLVINWFWRLIMLNNPQFRCVCDALYVCLKHRLQIIRPSSFLVVKTYWLLWPATFITVWTDVILLVALLACELHV